MIRVPGVRTIDVYILNEFLISFVVAFLFFFCTFFINQLLVLAEEIFSKKVPFGDVIRFVVFSLPSILALSLPFGALVGALMAMGRFSSDNEILAFRACGVAQSRILLPLLGIGVLLFLVSFVMNDYFLPLGNIRLGSMYRKILYTNPGIELEPYSVKRYQDTVIVTGDIQANVINNITIIDKTEDQEKRVITARSGFLEESRNQKGVISIRLNEVFSHVPDAAVTDRYEFTTSESMIYNILLKDFSASFINPGPREMRSIDVWREIQEMDEQYNRQAAEQSKKTDAQLFDLTMELRYLRDFAPARPQLYRTRQANLSSVYTIYTRSRDRKFVDRNLQLYRLEFHKKFSIPFSCVVFVLFAFPVGMLARKSGKAVGFGIGLLMASLYWWLLLIGHTLGIRLELPPAFAMWFPNLVVFIAGLTLLLVRTNR
ncbi:MAG: LptF/LptG family permease [Spirochaetaceae bacterium]|nr:MAG: LptF/LptG family permease [Spirochaetaceae bacterium]